MADGYELDIDRERVCVDGEWLSAADIAGRIKDKVAAGDYRVTHLSAALERLEETMAQVKEVTLKLTPELMEGFDLIAKHEELPVALAIRRALVYYIASDDAAARLFKARRAELADQG